MYLENAWGCLHTILHEFIVINGNSVYQLFKGLLVEIPAILDSFFTNTTSTLIGVEGGGWWGATKWRVKANHNCQQWKTAQNEAPLSCKYPKMQLNQWPTPWDSRVKTPSRLTAHPWPAEPFKDHPSIRGRLTRHRNKPRQKQTKDPLTPILAQRVS